jgi:hypothetical protein
MPTINLPVQANGELAGWSSIVGGTFGYDAIDESNDSDDDGDTSYIVLPRQIGTAGIMSFRFFDGSENLIPTSVTIRTSIKLNSGNPEVEVGFYRGGATAFSMTTVIPGAQYDDEETTFSTNPFNASAWAADDLLPMQPCLRMLSGAIGTARVSLISVELSYRAALLSRAHSVSEDYGVMTA